MDLIDFDAEFDAWLEENEETTIPFRLLDRDWELPADIPAATMFKLERLERAIEAYDPDNPSLPEGIDLEDITYESLTRSMIGDELVDEWLRLGIGHKKLQHVTRRLNAIYRSRQGSIGRGGGDDEGKAPEVEEGSPAES